MQCHRLQTLHQWTPLHLLWPLRQQYRRPPQNRLFLVFLVRLKECLSSWERKRQSQWKCQSQVRCPGCPVWVCGESLREQILSGFKSRFRATWAQAWGLVPSSICLRTVQGLAHLLEAEALLRLPRWRRSRMRSCKQLCRLRYRPTTCVPLTHHSLTHYSLTTHSLTDLLTHSLTTHSLTTHSPPTHSLTYSLTHSLLSHSLTYSLLTTHHPLTTHSLTTHSLTHFSLTHSLTTHYSLTHSLLTHYSLTHSLTTH